jgi:hypothetical protein
VRLLLGLLSAVIVAAGALAAPAVVRVQVGADGSLSPAAVTIKSGDTIEWTFTSRRQAVVAAQSEAAATNACPVPRAFDARNPAAFAGPVSFAPGGVFSLAPLEDRGLQLVRGAVSRWAFASQRQRPDAVQQRPGAHDDGGHVGRSE